MALGICRSAMQLVGEPPEPSSAGAPSGQVGDEPTEVARTERLTQLLEQYSQPVVAIGHSGSAAACITLTGSDV